MRKLLQTLIHLLLWAYALSTSETDQLLENEKTSNGPSGFQRRFNSRLKFVRPIAAKDRPNEPLIGAGIDHMGNPFLVLPPPVEPSKPKKKPPVLYGDHALPKNVVKTESERYADSISDDCSDDQTVRKTVVKIVTARPKPPLNLSPAIVTDSLSHGQHANVDRKTEYQNTLLTRNDRVFADSVLTSSSPTEHSRILPLQQSVDNVLPSFDMKTTETPKYSNKVSPDALVETELRENGAPQRIGIFQKNDPTIANRPSPYPLPTVVSKENPIAVYPDEEIVENERRDKEEVVKPSAPTLPPEKTEMLAQTHAEHLSEEQVKPIINRDDVYQSETIIVNGPRDDANTVKPSTVAPLQPSSDPVKTPPFVEKPVQPLISITPSPETFVPDVSVASLQNQMPFSAETVVLKPVGSFSNDFTAQKPFVLPCAKGACKDDHQPSQIVPNSSLTPPSPAVNKITYYNYRIVHDVPKTLPDATKRLSVDRCGESPIKHAPKSEPHSSKLGWPLYHIPFVPPQPTPYLFGFEYLSHRIPTGYAAGYNDLYFSPKSRVALPAKPRMPANHGAPTRPAQSYQSSKTYFEYPSVPLDASPKSRPVPAIASYEPGSTENAVEPSLVLSTLLLDDTEKRANVVSPPAKTVLPEAHYFDDLAGKSRMFVRAVTPIKYHNHYETTLDKDNE